MKYHGEGEFVKVTERSIKGETGRWGPRRIPAGEKKASFARENFDRRTQIRVPGYRGALGQLKSPHRYITCPQLEATTIRESEKRLEREFRKKGNTRGKNK